MITKPMTPLGSVHEAGQTSTLPTHLDLLLAAHRDEAARLRVELSDPEEAMGRIVRDSFEADSLAAAFRYLTEGGSLWDDEPDER